MDLLAFPFSLRPNGTAATVPEGSTEVYAQEVALLCLTRKGERDLVPDYGTTDPVVDLLDVTELNAALRAFGPDVTVDSIAVEYPDDRTAVSTLTFSV